MITFSDTPALRKLRAAGSDHMQDFTNAMRTRQTPRETAGIANNAALAVHMANLAYRHGTKVTWDQAQQRPTW